MPGSDGVKVIWEVVENHGVDETNESGYIGLLWLYFL